MTDGAVLDTIGIRGGFHVVQGQYVDTSHPQETIRRAGTYLKIDGYISRAGNLYRFN